MLSLPRVFALAATAPRWLVVASAAALSLATHSAAYRLGGAHEFRAGFAAGERATHATHRAATAHRKARQLEDRRNAETSTAFPDQRSEPDSLRCGPSTRDCPE